MAKVKRKRKRYTDAQHVEVLERIALGESYASISRVTGVGYQTVLMWRDAETKKSKEFQLDTDTIQKLRAENKEKFVKQAWQSIEMASELIRRKLERALNDEAVIDKIVAEVAKDIEESKKGNFAKGKERGYLDKIKAALKLEDISKVADVMAKVYDKQALASNENTQNIGVNRKLEDFIKDLGKESD